MNYLNVHTSRFRLPDVQFTDLSSTERTCVGNRLLGRKLCVEPEILNFLDVYFQNKTN